MAVSVFTLSAISVERWYAICYPLHFKSTKRRAKIIILVIWIIAFLLALPEIIFAELHRSVQRQYIDLLISCRPSWPSMSNQVVYQGLMMVLMYLLPLILMTVTYSMIAVVLWTGRIPGAIESGGYMFFIILTKSMVLSSRVGASFSSFCQNPWCYRVGWVHLFHHSDKIPGDKIPGAIESGGYMFFIILTKSMVLSSRVGTCFSSY